MHRLIMSSSAYRQSASHRAKVSEDPSNRFIWRMPMQRMDAEQLRDSFLSVTGELDLRMGGPADKETKSLRRSIYLLNKRNKLSTMTNAFDTPDLHNSCPTRDTTTTPIQALTLLNGDWALERAERFADRILGLEGIDVEGRISEAYRLALGRNPDSRDLETSRNFIEETRTEEASRRKAWVDLCHILLNTNEFMYIN